ncbi:MAG: ORF6N domain-containing protein [Bacteroidales bacterium]|nr:ORF6N domain-containing protein [Bacteroidales bacterium]
MNDNHSDKITTQDDVIIRAIHFLRGENVILDTDLAILYGVETRVLKQAVRRNPDRFPIDFMFQLTKEELDSLRSQNVTLKRGQHRKYLPFAFTKQGVAMLSGILNSSQAIQVNILIIRTFVQLRRFSFKYDLLEEKVSALEKRFDKQFKIVFQAIRLLIKSDQKPMKRIGYKYYE